MTRVGRPLGSAFAGRAGIELILLGCPMMCLMPTESLRSRITTLHVHAGVSIHAPARGATRALPDLSAAFERSFNPRARAGRDYCRHESAPARQHVSIHAPAWGATSAALAAYMPSSVVSIHAPARGATRADRIRIRRCDRCFNPRARAGRDAHRCTAAARRLAFQSTRPRGARPVDGRATSRVTYVSIHAPARGATRRDRGRSPASRVSIHAPARGATV